MDTLAYTVAQRARCRSKTLHTYK